MPTRYYAAFIVLFAAFLGNPFPGCAGAILGSAQSFTVLGYGGVTNAGATQIYGNVGVSPTPSITGFPQGAVTGGTILGPGSTADQALADIDAGGRYLGGIGGDGQLCHKSGWSHDHAGRLLFVGCRVPVDRDGGARFSFFCYRARSRPASASVVSVINGGPGTEVYWVLGSGAELGSGSTFQGNILAYAGIALDSTANIGCGRAFSETGAVTLIANNISGNCSAQDFGGTQSDFGSLGFSGGTGTNGGGTGSFPSRGRLRCWA